MSPSDIGRAQLEMYAARKSRGAAITMERFIELCKEVIQEGAKAGRSRVFLIKLRAELGYLYPYITSPGILERGTGKTEMDEIFRLTGAHMNPPFDIEEAINQELSGEESGVTNSRRIGLTNTAERTEKEREHGNL